MKASIDQIPDGPMYISERRGFLDWILSCAASYSTDRPYHQCLLFSAFLAPHLDVMRASLPPVSDSQPPLSAKRCKAYLIVMTLIVLPC